MNCNKCGKELRPEAHFCQSCGAPVESLEKLFGKTVSVPVKKEDYNYEKGISYTAKRCRECGTKILPNQKYCSSCGLQVLNFEQPPRYGITKETNRLEGSEKSIIIPITIGILVTIIVICISVGIFVQKRSVVNKAEATTSNKNTEEQIVTEESNSNTEPKTESVSESEVVPQTTVSDTNDYIIADSSTRQISKDELVGLSAWELRIAINEIYARHGRKFNSSELNEYFRNKTWYNPTIDAEYFNKHEREILSSIEIKNTTMMDIYAKENGYRK